MIEMVKALWQVLAMMAPWLLGGFVLAGAVGVLMPREWAQKAMGRAKGWKGVLNAVLIGVPLPVCSCGVLPITQALRKSGASKGAAVGFLISTPQTGIDSILATYALLGPVFAVARPVAAFLTGLAGGIAVNAMTAKEGADLSLEPDRQTHCCCCCHRPAASPLAARTNVVLRCLIKANELFGEIVKPLSFGIAVAAAVTVCVPENFFTAAFGGKDYLAMPAMAIVGFPMYICSTASIPIAASMVLKGLSPGAAFVFLMVGPAINAASFATVCALIGRLPAFVYAFVIALGAILCGVAINILPFDVLPSLSAGCAVEHLSLFEHAAVLILIAWMAGVVVGKSRNRRANE